MQYNAISNIHVEISNSIKVKRLERDIEVQKELEQKEDQQQSCCSVLVFHNKTRARSQLQRRGTTTEECETYQVSKCQFGLKAIFPLPMYTSLCYKFHCVN